MHRTRTIRWIVTGAVLGFSLWAETPDIAPVVFAASSPVGPGLEAKRETEAGTAQRRRRRRRRVTGQRAPAAERIKEIQAALGKTGFYSGTPNGKWDSKSIEAMKKFQKKNEINATGKINARTLQALGLGSEVAGRNAPVSKSDKEARNTDSGSGSRPR